MTNFSLTELRAKLLAGECSVREVWSAYRARAEETKEHGAYLEYFDIDESEIEKAQKVLDAQKENSPILTGIPIAVKDNILVKDRVATAASKILEGYTAPYDATVTQKLREAGALFVGRTNMDEFAMGSSNEHSAYGVVKNPHDPSRVPGGSSGGSAAAVALGTAPVALGSDTGGSIRQPAALCGVVGLKPTYGAVSRYGLIALGSSLDQIGPLTRTVEDAETMLSVLQGVDEKDSTTRSGTGKEVGDTLTIGVPRAFLEKGVDEDVKKCFEEHLVALEKKGHVLRDIEMPSAAYGIPMYYVIMPAEASTNLSRYDGVRFGSRVAAEDFNTSFIETRTQGFGEEVRRRILLGTYVLSSGYIDAYYNTAVHARDIFRKEVNALFEEVDIIATPTTPTPAFKIGEKTNDPLALYLEDIFTVSANLTGHPALSVPMGTVVREGSSLPIGIQFTAPHFSERGLFKIGKAVEEHGILETNGD